MIALLILWGAIAAAWTALATFWTVHLARRAYWNWREQRNDRQVEQAQQRVTP